MRLHVFSIGKPRLAFAKAGIEEYLARFPAKNGIEVESLRASDSAGESKALLSRSEGLFRVVLDERGEGITSRQLAQKLSGWEMQRVKGVAFLIGGADGHTDELRAAADWRWSLSPLTLQHELALVLLLEQLYRARCILAGTPYHRD